MIYITGANGWLGLNLVKSIYDSKTEQWGIKKDGVCALILPGTDKKKLLKISSKIKIIEGDICKEDDVKKFLTLAEGQYLIHIAGIIHPKKVSEFFKINRDGTKNILNQAVAKKIKKAVLMSSNSPIGCNPHKNHLFDEESPYNPYMNYGKSKMEMEILAKDFIDKNLLNLTIVRSPWFYGPYQPERQKLFFEMIKNGKVPIVGNGNNKRSMAYTENIAQGIFLSLSKEISSGKIYWIADEKPYTMNEVVETIANLIDKDFNQKVKHSKIKLPNFVGFLAEKADMILQSTGLYNQKVHVLSEMNKNIACNIDKAKEELGYKPSFNLSRGMKECLKEVYEP